MVWPMSLEKDLTSLANTLRQQPVITDDSVPLSETTLSLYLSIKKLKIFLPSHGSSLITWAYTLLKERSPTNDTTSDSLSIIEAVLKDSLSKALVELLSESVLFLEAIEERALEVLVNLALPSIETPSCMLWLLCLAVNYRPCLLVPCLHHYLIQSLAVVGNPWIESTVTLYTSNPHIQLNVLGHVVFGYLLGQHTDLVKKSVVDVLDQYLQLMTISKENEDTSMVDQDTHTQDICIERYRLAYLLALPTLAPGLTQACWADVFKRLLDDHSAGAIFLYERQSNASLVRRPSGEIVSLASVFPLWLSSVAFSQDGLVMKHALDVAVMLDTLAYDPRLALTHLIPAGDKSILDSMRPSFDQLDLQPSSIDLVHWTLSLLAQSNVRGPDSLKIALFLMQLRILKCTTGESAADLLVSLITRLEHPTATPESSHGIRYLVLHLIASAETKWSNVFHIVLENIFSKAIALHIANSEGAVSVEKILGNLAMLFEVCEEVYPRAGAPRPGFLAFQAYIVGHWQQVLLLFVSHPFMECRAMGYRVLANSRLWEATGEDVQPMLLSKMLMEAWFRHMKHRFLRITLHEREEENYVLDELQRLILGCCQNIALAKTLLCLGLDSILQGALEIFLTADMNHLQREKTSLLDKVRECGEGSGAGGGSGEEGEEGTGGSTKLSLVQRPPQFITTTDLLNGELDVRDKFYINNIERTATLFYGYRDDKEMSKEHRAAISLSVLSHLTSKWPQQKVSFDAYDKVLPKNIPYAIDITTGNAFKDHPVLFLIIEQCSTMTHTSISDITRSILVYFIAFWHIPEVAKENTTLKYATQLEETSRLLMLLRPYLPLSLHQVHRLFPFVSAKDLGDILYLALWPCIRWHPTCSETEIPGLGPSSAKDVSANTNTTNTTHTTTAQSSLQLPPELEETSMKKLVSIYHRRLKKLEAAGAWHTTLQTLGRALSLDRKVKKEVSTV